VSDQQDKPRMAYHRVLLKLSGEALAGHERFGINTTVINRIAREVHETHSRGVQIAIVLGGGNIFRGVKASAQGMDRASADYMGMLATVINSLALQDALEKQGCYTRVMSSIGMQQIAEPYIRRRAKRHLEKGRVVIFAGGTGNPYFSTDTAAALRAMEIQAELIFKATKVDGVYDVDPSSNENAVMFHELTYIEVLKRNLKVMDSTAISLCMDNNLPIVVFNLSQPGSIGRALRGEPMGTTVRAGGLNRGPV